MNKISQVHMALYAVIFLLIGYLFFNAYKSKTIAVVDTQLVIENYQGFKEAQNLYETQTKEMSLTFEKQKAAYESKSNEFKILIGQLSAKEIEVKKQELESLKAKIFQLGKAIENKALQQEGKLLQGVYNKINDFIKRYAEANNIYMIEGITSTGNVLYASDEIDLSQTIIDGLNKEYVEGIKE